MKWTKEETSLLKENMDKALVGLKRVFPNKSEDQIIEKIKLLYRKGSSKRWTEEEDTILKTNSKRTPFYLMKLLPNRSYSSILYRRNYIGISVREHRDIWSDEELQQLKLLKEDGFMVHEIAEILNKPINSVINYSYKHGFVKRNNTYINWTEEQEKIIIEYLSNGRTLEDLVSVLGVDKQRVINKAKHLGFPYKDILTERKIARSGSYGDSQVYKNKIYEMRLEINRLKNKNKKLEKQLERNR